MKELKQVRPSSEEEAWAPEMPPHKLLTANDGANAR